MTEDENPKLTKTEEKESFLKQLEAKTLELKKVEENIQKVLERNEELAARHLLGGKSDSVAQSNEPVIMSDREYARKVLSGEIKPTG